MTYLRSFKDEAVNEFRELFKVEAADTMKQAIAKIFYAKKEILTEITAASNKFLQAVESSSNSRKEKDLSGTFGVRLDRIGVEVA